MSVERLVARRGRKMHCREVELGGKLQTLVSEGFGWWAIRQADLIERRIVTDREWGHSTIRYTPRPKRPIRERQTLSEQPEMVARPDGMSRQVQRRLYRNLCKQLGVPRKTGR